MDPEIGHRSDATRSGIDEMPVEIFNHVLEYLRDIDPPGVQHSRQLGWLNVTFVSQGWRACALANPSLWTCIPLNVGKTWASVFFERSHTLSVDIDLEGPITDRVNLLSRNFHRIRTLDIGYSERTEGVDPIYTLIEQPSDNLETLILHRYWQYLESPRLTPRQYPRLRTLHLIFREMYGEDLPWRVIGNAGLTELKIQLRHPDDNDRCLADVLFMLKQLPSLKTLELRLSAHVQGRRREINSQVDHGIMHRTYLSNLRRLTLEAEVELILHVMVFITFSTDVETTLLPIHTPAIERRSLFSNLIPWISARTMAGPPKRLSLTGGLYRHPQIVAGRSLELGREVFLRLNTDSVMCDAFPDILCSMEPAAIHFLDIATLVPLSYNDDCLLSHLSTLCRNITCITVLPLGVQAAEAPGAVTVILRRLLLPAAGDIADPPFTKLAALDFTDFSKKFISARCMNPEDAKPYRALPPTLADSIKSIVQARHAAGAVTPRIYLREWTSPLSRFEEGVLEVVRTIPGVELVPKGKRFRMPPNGVLSEGGLRNLVSREQFVQAQRSGFVN
ncbi:hypothetical protein PENSPDRAFT_755622 [Peniophora sp. CONT]|nr:hypothetical protein PENSPDRAFT_755622 [Peniophora sp. CONT]